MKIEIIGTKRESRLEKALKDAKEFNRDMEAKLRREKLSQKVQQRKTKIENTKEKSSSSLDDKIESGLIVAAENKIYCIELNKNGKKILVAKRSDYVFALCSHNGRLYDGGSYKAVYDTLKNKKIAKRSGCVGALCVHDDRLFDGGDYNAVYNTLNNKIVAERPDWIHTLCVHNDRLYDGGDYRAVYDTLNNKIVAERSNWIRALCVYNDRLYDGGDYNAVYDTLNNKIVARRSGRVFALCVHNGILYNLGYKAVYDTFNDKKGKHPVFTFDKKVITAMSSIPIDLWERLARKGKVVK